MFLSAIVAGCSTGPDTKNTTQDLSHSHKTENFYGQMKLEKFTLANGLKLVVLQDDRSPTFSYHTWFDVGSMDEQVGLTGLAHLFEHMMFKATKNNAEGVFDRKLEGAGTQQKNAFTSRDYTAYVQSLPKDKLEMIAELESDRMVNLIVEKDVLDKEREVVKNERRFRTENSPDGTMYEKLYELMYKTHPYHWPIIGYEKDLDNATTEQCYQFYQNHYAPNNATIVIAGNIDPDQALSVIKKYYGHLKSQKISKYSGPAEPEQLAPKTTVMRLPISVEKIFVAFRMPNQRHPDAPVIELLGNIIAHTQTSRLYKRLVDAGIATNVDAYYNSGKSEGMFIIMANMQQGRKAADAKKIIFKEIGRLRTGGITAAELRAALNRYKFDLFTSLESNFSKAQHIGFLETVMGSAGKGATLLKKMERLSAADVNRAARQYLTKNSSTTIVGIPKGSK